MINNFKSNLLSISFILILSNCNTMQENQNESKNISTNGDIQIENAKLLKSNDYSEDYFTRTGDNQFVDSILLQFKDHPNDLFELEAEYMINSSFDMFYSIYLKEIGKIHVSFDKRTRLYITKFNYRLNEKMKNEYLKNPDKYPQSFVNTLKSNLPLYLFVTAYDVKYSGGNRFADEGFTKNQIGESWGMANYGGGEGKIFSINFMYVDNNNESDQKFKLSSYNTKNKYFGFIEIGKVSSQYSGVLEVENNGKFKSPSFNFMKYDYSFHINDKISKEYDKAHFSNSENTLLIELFSKYNQFKDIDQLIENSKYKIYGEHIEVKNKKS